MLTVWRSGELSASGFSVGGSVTSAAGAAAEDGGAAPPWAQPPLLSPQP
jgi:hypothetical protein